MAVRGCGRAEKNGPFKKAKKPKLKQEVSDEREPVIWRTNESQSFGGRTRASHGGEREPVIWRTNGSRSFGRRMRVNHFRIFAERPRNSPTQKNPSFHSGMRDCKPFHFVRSSLRSRAYDLRESFSTSEGHHPTLWDLKIARSGLLKP